MNWYNCTIKYDKLDESGQLKKVSEQILVNSLNFTEAENKIISFKSEEIKGEFYITKITIEHLEEIVNLYNDSDYWFKAKAIVIDTDESGKEKKYTKIFYIAAPNFETATEELRKYLDNAYLVDTYIYTLSLTKITDIIQ